MKLRIDSRCRINYASYYIKGMWELFGTKNVTFGLIDCGDLYENIQDYNKCMTIIAENKTESKKIVIDFDDDDSISLKHYEWCDVYAKINVKADDLHKYVKIIAVGPSFGINITGFYSVLLLIKMFFINKKPVSSLTYLKNHLYMKVRRREYDKYLNSKSVNDYIFAISTLWYDPLTYETTNKYRIEFFKICKKIYKNVEGGFFYITDDIVLKQFPKYIEYKEKYNTLLYTQRVSPSEYITKTKKSAVVFNTPSVSGCHGWKLAEYFAMGKVIITTPLSNVMPEGLSAGKNIIIVEDQTQLEFVINKLHLDSDLSSKLEKEACNYFESKLSPCAVMSSILEKAFEGA